MRYLVISPYFPPALGGACRMLGNIADSLSESGHLVDVLAFVGSNDRAVDDHDESSAATIHRVPADSQNVRAVLAMGQRLLGLLMTRKKYDLIFCGVAYSSGLLAYLTTRGFPTPYVVYSHGEDVTVIEGKPVKQVLLGRALQGAAHVFANSGFTRDALLRMGTSPERLEILHPSINPEKYLRMSDERAARLRESIGLRGKTVLLTVARLQERKGHDTVVRALPAILARIPDAHYLIIGKGDQTRLRRLADSLGVSRDVTILNSLDEDDLAAAYRACDLYVMVSRADASREAEGFGMVYLEAGAAGRPSVCGNDGGAPEAVLHGETGLIVDARSAEETASAVIELLSDPARRTQMGLAARERVVNQFSDKLFLGRIKEVCAKYARPAEPRRDLERRPASDGGDLSDAG